MNKKLIFGIIVIIIILIIIFILSRKSYVHNVLKKDYIYLTDFYNEFVNSNLLPKSNSGIQYTYAFWLYFNNLGENSTWKNNFKYKRPILYRYGAPNVYYLPKTHELQIDITYKNIIDLKDVYSFELKDLPIQKWFHVALVQDGVNYDVYYNGELHSSTILPNVPIVSNKFLYLGSKNNNFNGYLYHLEYANINLQKNAIRKLYNSSKKNLPSNLMSYSEFFDKFYKKD